MLWRMIKIGSVVLIVGTVAGAVVFGRDLVSYASSSAGAMRQAVKDSVPIEFELRRARDLLDQIIPEMHANIRLIAQEEVEVAALERDIAGSTQNLDDERVRVAKLRNLLNSDQVRFVVAGRQYQRTQVCQDLARRLDRVKEAQMVLASKERLLSARQKSLAAARDMLERTRSQKVLLGDRIGALESQYRLVQAAAVGSHMELDNSKLAQTEKLIDQIRKRLDVAERVLAHESRFTQPIPIDTVVDEKDLLTQVDEYLAGPEPEAQQQQMKADEHGPETGTQARRHEGT